MPNPRPSFDELVLDFKCWLKQEGWSDDILWLSSDRISGRRKKLWLFRPEEMTSTTLSRLFYDKIRDAGSSIRIDALCKLGNKTVAYVSSHGGDGAHLNFGILKSQYIFSQTRSRLLWVSLRAWNRILGESSLIQYTELTPPNIK